MKRSAVLCDEKVSFEKQKLRMKWRFAARNILRNSNDVKYEDLRFLLESDEENDSDVEFIETGQEVMVISSDDDDEDE